MEPVMDTYRIEEGSGRLGGSAVVVAREVRSSVAVEPRQIKLGRGRVWASNEAAGRMITCLFGSVWVTVEGDGRDFVLEPMMRVTLAAAGRVVVEGLEAAVIEVR
jgi:hypothetical protein